MNTQAGRFNSSITRVRPVFMELIRKDKTGHSWLPPLLRLASTNRKLAESMAAEAGTLVPEMTRIREYQDRVLSDYGKETVKLPSCFEYRIPPPTAFLRWLIEHPDRMSWSEEKGTSPGTIARRRRLFDQRDDAVRNGAIKEALVELAREKNTGSARQWWAFEGFTEVDCCLETERTLLLIEGKRTESLSASTRWYRGRNQLVRNLETAQEAAGTKLFAVMTISEEPIEPLDTAAIEQSLPHLSPRDREALMCHDLGNTTWRESCQATGLHFEELPSTTKEAMDRGMYEF